MANRPVAAHTPIDQPSAAPHPKTYAGLAGSSVGGAFATLVIAILKRHDVALEPDEVAAMMTLVCALLGFASAYMTPSVAAVEPTQPAVPAPSPPPPEPESVPAPALAAIRRPDRRFPTAMALLAAFLVLAPLQSCAPLQAITGVEARAPRTARERYVVADESYQAALRTARDLVQQGVISRKTDKDTLTQIVQDAGASLDSAGEAVLSGGTDQTAAVSAAETAVLRLTQWLAAREAQRSNP